MKPSFRRIRRKTAASKDNNPFKREATQEHSFFGQPVHEPFFQPQTTIQRKCEKCEEEDKKAMRKTDEGREKEEDKKVQKKENTGSAQSTIPSFASSLAGGSHLPAQTAAFFSARLGHDFSGVKIHTGPDAAQSARALHAQAYTIGNDIVFSEGLYAPNTLEGQKLLAHELVHVVQQEKDRISKKDEEPECNEELDLEGYTDAVYNKGPGTTIGEKKKKARDCEDCDEDCVQVTGFLKVSYKVDTTVTLPDVPEDLRPCQKQRVANAIKFKLSPHEQKHVAAFKTFNGSPLLPIKYKGCAGGYDSYLEGLAETEFERRKGIADAKSAKLDPYTENVDLCCKDAAPKK